MVNKHLRSCVVQYKAQGQIHRQWRSKQRKKANEEICKEEAEVIGDIGTGRIHERERGREEGEVCTKQGGCALIGRTGGPSAVATPLGELLEGVRC